MREKASKDETYSFIKIATNIMFTQMSENTGIKKFGEKVVVSMVKNIDKQT